MHFLLKLTLSHMFLFGLFLMILRGGLKKIVIYVGAWSASIFLKRFTVSILTFRSLNCLPFTLCMVLGSILISWSFSLFQEPAHCPPQWLYPIVIPSISGEGFSFLHILYSTCCSWRFCHSDQCMIILCCSFAFLFSNNYWCWHVFMWFFSKEWVKLNSWNQLLECLSCFECFFNDHPRTFLEGRWSLHTAWQALRILSSHQYSFWGCYGKVISSCSTFFFFFFAISF